MRYDYKDYDDALTGLDELCRIQCVKLLLQLIEALDDKQNIIHKEERDGSISDFRSGVWNGMEEAKSEINQYLVHGKQI